MHLGLVQAELLGHHPPRRLDRNAQVLAQHEQVKGFLAMLFCQRRLLHASPLHVTDGDQGILQA
jgi:hypothetical protein